MKNKLFRISVLIMSLILTLSAGIVGCDSADHPVLPDYSNGKDFEFFSYRTLTDGHYSVDGVDYFTGEDFRSVERWQEYKECGFTMAYINDRYSGEPWENSALKQSMEKAYTAGMEKIIVHDNRLSGLCDMAADGINQEYPTDEELDEYVEELMTAGYANMDGFYGFVLKDEPNYKKHESYGRTYKSIMRIAKKLYAEGKCKVEEPYIHMNFLPMGGADAMSVPDTFVDETGAEREFADFTDVYTKYLEGFITSSGTKRISVDTYAFMRNQVTAGFFPSLQIMADLAAKYDIDTSYCLQSFHMMKGSTHMFSKVGKSEMYYEINSVIGHGMDNFAYYTYCPDTGYATQGTSAVRTIDGGNFLTRDGQKTNVYYYAQSIMEEMKPLGKIINSYEFMGSDFIVNDGVLNFDTAFINCSNPFPKGTSEALLKLKGANYRRGYQYNLLKEVKLDNDIAFVSEFYDGANDLYLYMLQNAINPDAEDGKTSMTITATFDASYEWVAEYNCGVINYVQLENGVYTKTLPAGYAVYLIPLK